ncbi:MAG: hypothetical protein AVDCRST_MAG90-573, partial [uncultured Microvirga sp.]
ARLRRACGRGDRGRRRGHRRGGHGAGSRCLPLRRLSGPRRALLLPL